MKLSLLNELSEIIPQKKSSKLDLNQSASGKLKSLLSELQEDVQLQEDLEIPSKRQKYVFLGIDRRSAKHRAMEEEMETIKIGDPILHQKIISLD